MQSLTTVILKPGEADRIVAGHPWVYRGSVLRLTHPAADGDVVQVKDHRQRLLGSGFYNSKSKISVRLLSAERVHVDEPFFENRIRVALAVRERLTPGATSFRVVNAEADFLSGLIVDKYEEVLAIQISSLGMDRHKSLIIAALRRIFSPQAIVERSDVASRRFEGLEESHGLLEGDLPEKVIVRLNGLSFETDLLALGRAQDWAVPGSTSQLSVGQSVVRGISGLGLLQFHGWLWTSCGPRRCQARAHAGPKC